jgi:glycosyltransferase involved in cell wall biosynthesis
MNTPLVSIIINNFNYAQFLSVAIDSALAQSYQAIEVIVVDDGSSDSSREIIGSYGQRIRPLLKANGGQASTFNAGFAASQGDIVIFLDADDALFPETVARVVAAWKPGISKLQYRLQVCDRLGKPLGLHPAPSKPLDQGWVWPLLLRQGNYTTPVTSGNAFSRAALSQLLPMPEADYRIAADGYLNTVVTFLGPIAALEVPLGLYRMHGNNLWATGQEVNLERLRKFIRHDLQRYSLIRVWGKQMVHAAAQDLEPQDLGLKDLAHLKHRLLSLRLNPRQHPLPQDSIGLLVRSALVATWSQASLSLLERFRLSIWFLRLGYIPTAWMQPAYLKPILQRV